MAVGKVLVHAKGMPIRLAGAFGDGGNESTYLRFHDPGPIDQSSTYHAPYGRIETASGPFEPLAMIEP